MPSDSVNSEIRKLLSHPVSIVGILVISILTIALVLIFEKVGIGSVADPVSINLVGIVINGLLTVFLLTIYAEMRTTQVEQQETEEQQKELQKEIADLQGSLTSMESEPQVVMEQLQLSELDDEDLCLTLSNIGRGFARNLKITIDAEVYRGADVELEFATYTESPMRRKAGESLVGGRDYLMPNEDKVMFDFSAYVEIIYKDLGPDIPVYPTYKVNEVPEAILTQDIHSGEISPEDLGYQREGLSDDFWTTEDACHYYNIQLINMKIGLVYDIVGGEQRTESLTDYIVPACQDLSTEEALREGLTREEYEWGLNNEGDYFNTLSGYDRSIAIEKGSAETRTPPDF